MIIPEPNPILSLIKDSEMTLAGDFLDLADVTMFVHNRGATPEVILVSNPNNESMSFPFGLDVIFGFITPAVYWGDVVHKWQKNWYEKYDKPIEEFENEGGPCV